MINLNEPICGKLLFPVHVCVNVCLCDAAAGAGTSLGGEERKK